MFLFAGHHRGILRQVESVESQPGQCHATFLPRISALLYLISQNLGHWWQDNPVTRDPLAGSPIHALHEHWNLPLVFALIISFTLQATTSSTPGKCDICRWTNLSSATAKLHHSFSSLGGHSTMMRRWFGFLKQWGQMSGASSIILLPPLLERMGCNSNSDIFRRELIHWRNYTSSLSLQGILAVIRPMTFHPTDTAKVILLRLWFDIFNRCLQPISIRIAHWFEQLEPQPLGEIRHVLGYFVWLVTQWYAFVPHIYSEGTIPYQCICMYFVYSRRNANRRYYRPMVDFT